MKEIMDDLNELKDIISEIETHIADYCKKSEQKNEIAIVFNGNTEEYFYKRGVSFVEATSACSNSDKKLLSRKFLWEEDKEQNKCRWELLYEKLEKISPLACVWTADSNNYNAWYVRLGSGATIAVNRNDSDSDVFALYKKGD